MSWATCMLKKIEDEWGPDAGKCLRDLGSDDLGEIAACILKVVGEGADPIVNLVPWSVECLL